MKRWVKSISQVARKFHQDEGGADMVEYILIIAAVALPVLAIIIWFRDDIEEWARGQYEDVKDASN
jgi:Flp pilus assembly pilin Flp